MSGRKDIDTKGEGGGSNARFGQSQGGRGCDKKTTREEKRYRGKKTKGLD